MVQYCVVPGCKNNALIPGLSFHSFPKDLKLKKIWEMKIKRAKKCKPITQHMKVCSDHFSKSDYKCTFYDKRKYLEKDAVPSIFSWTKKNKERREIHRFNIVHNNQGVSPNFHSFRLIKIFQKHY